MSCTSPIQAWQRGDAQPVFNEPKRGELFLYRALEVPCQQCLDCRLRRARDWSVRIMHEASMHAENCVLTLTYDDAHMPPHGRLNYPDVQKFIRALRKKYPGINLLYVCGCEYGEEPMPGRVLGRPHYHICVMGFDFPDKEYWSKAGDGSSKLWTSKSLDALWKRGICRIGELTRESADYVARYCVQKRTGPQAESWYRGVDLSTGEVYQLPPECIRVSSGRRNKGQGDGLGRGIGARWFTKFRSDVFPADHLVLRGGTELKPPRYYDKLEKRRDAQAFEAVRAKREAEAQTPQRMADETPQRRSVRAQCTKARNAMKRRGL